ncbi:MAG: D-alanyl-D-alanine carboxypeptidase/D-alanyl-D-alanine endopeptidase, partial [Gemmatimonadales bacterium]
GDLVLYGRGDPTFGVRCYANDTTLTEVCDRDAFAKFRLLADTLKARGVRVVDGDLVGDGSYFEPVTVHPDWGFFDLNWWYAAPVSGLGFNDNSVDIAWGPGPSVGAPAALTLTPDLGDVRLENRSRTVGPDQTTDIQNRMFREPGTLHLWAEGTVALNSAGGTESFALPDPNLFAARALRSVLLETGIAVTGTTRSTTDSVKYRSARETAPLAEVVSRPVKDWIFPVLNTSQNWYAEMLLKQLGRQFGKAGSWPEGLAVERRFLIDSIKVDSTQFDLDDGSGLANQNLVSPLVFTRILRFIRGHPRFASFRAGLPQSGQAGSLRRRFVGTPLEGKVWAKTGSIGRVNTLTGFIELDGGRTLTFSIQANNHTLAERPMLALLDSLVVEMGRK